MQTLLKAVNVIILREVLQTGVDAGHIKILMAAMQNPEHLPDGKETRKLLDTGHLLPYPNEIEWYYPHPLLTTHLLRSSDS